MAKITVVEIEGRDGYTASCDCGFKSFDWPTKKLATERGAQHLDEHETGQPMPLMSDFMKSAGGEK